MSERAVVITGVGAISCHGAGADTLWRAARDGKSGARTYEFDRIEDQKVTQAAGVPPETVSENAVHVRPRMQDRVVHMALIAAEEAVQQSGLSKADFKDAGVIVGSGFGGANTLDDNYYFHARPHLDVRMDPFSIPKIMTNAAASWISMTFGANGPIYCNSTACSSAGQSIGMAYHMIKSGMLDRAITGGTEGCVVAGVFRAWEVLRVMTPTLCRPFSRDRNGMLLGEGAGILVLETKESAQARGATILAEVAGYGTTADAGDLLRPNPNGAARSMTQALQSGGLAPSDVAYVNAHGTATVANDVSETEAMRQVFGDGFDAVAVSSTKPVHGHGLGAAGALEAIVTINALRERIAPPNLHFTEQDPKIGFTPVTEARALDGRYAMSNSFAFGGINATLVFGRAQT
ncbi:3-oxoacyl-[acyl-carrier-protein] synthase, KASII [Candidatus Rhodobacter oscarellae]|uniref:Nodulation protein E n=1 Tax=Candidatus Rhodobacter oscarellae TaxID=1675527 RepID=A0A0J9GUS0_9RHOB|nr:beta-ketoacyl-[acyl-carrier-protein] synthase family protein [Candidatus Rhodobacter lobularis]KMW57323.1 3-oxoacyl-[acyl-carrier-protein] synthase, KASII [Candidatus Rhodobacter lobularis]